MKTSFLSLSLTSLSFLCPLIVADEPIRIVTFFTRKEGLTEAEFHDHWANIHGSLVAPWALQYGVNRYTQFHTTEANRTALKQALGLPDSFLLNYDGAADFTVSSIEEFLSAYKDPYYEKVIRPDEESLFVHSGDAMVIRGSLGWTKDIVKDAEPSIDTTAGCQKWLEVNGNVGKGC
ncbi:EthD domain-containing protein [Fusarium avenaceum]|nr:EthD domain-containing protein [Fusarium avenaceum]